MYKAYCRCMYIKYWIGTWNRKIKILNGSDQRSLQKNWVAALHILQLTLELTLQLRKSKLREAWREFPPQISIIIIICTRYRSIIQVKCRTDICSSEIATPKWNSTWNLATRLLDLCCIFVLKVFTLENYVKQICKRLCNNRALEKTASTVKGIVWQMYIFGNQVGMGVIYCDNKCGTKADLKTISGTITFLGGYGVKWCR